MKSIRLNALLGRAPIRRLSAEMLRDHVLRASGLLVERVGGPSVKPYQPKGLWQEKSGRAYQPDKGEGLWRRSLYTFWKRTSPPPSMMIFDSVKRDVCLTRRHVTNTPLQSLVLLNDPQFVEAARALASRALGSVSDEGGTARAELAIVAVYRRLCSRRPSSEELGILEELFEAQRQAFAAEPEAAEDLLSMGASPKASGLDPAELAALTTVASTLMNVDAHLTIR